MKPLARRRGIDGDQWHVLGDGPANARISIHDRPVRDVTAGVPRAIGRNAMGGCRFGVELTSYLAMRVGQQVLSLKEGYTPLSEPEFPTGPFYTGNPWFLAPCFITASGLTGRQVSVTKSENELNCITETTGFTYF